VAHARKNNSPREFLSEYSRVGSGTGRSGALERGGYRR
jgi:hypothetical protein